MSDSLRINMFGTFSITHGKKTISVRKKRMKIWMLLEYLITYRKREISQGELIELLWPGAQSDNPVNALKTAVHRVRSVLDELGYVDGSEMVQQRRGSYCWNVQIPIVLDAEVFEEMIAQAQASTSAEEAFELYSKAAELYKGDFLHDLPLDSFAETKRTRYKRDYTSAVKHMAEYLNNNEQHEKIVELMETALKFIPHEEAFHTYMMQSLIMLRENQKAAVHYEKASDVFLNEIGTPMPEALGKLYREISPESATSGKTPDDFRNELAKLQTQRSGAFLCKYEVFKDVYRVQARIIARSAMSIYICLITILDEEGNKIDDKNISVYMTRMSTSIKNSMRKGDVFSKYGANKYVLMFPTATYEDGRRIIERIFSTYRQKHTGDELSLTYSLKPIDPV